MTSHQPSQHEATPVPEHHASPPHRYSSSSSQDYNLPEIDLGDALTLSSTLPRYSTIESYISSDDDDFFNTDDRPSGDDGVSSLSLFHHGYTSADVPMRTLDEEAALPWPNDTTWRAPAPNPSSPPHHPLLNSSTIPPRKPVSQRDPPKPKPTLVTWAGDTDPAHPHNWPRHRRWTSTVLIAMFAFIAPMASTMVAPALEEIADEFEIEAEVERFLVMSIFLLAFAVGPFVWGPLSEVFGRVRVMQIANVIFLLFNTVCGWAKTKEQMMAFRFLSGIGGSAPQAIGGGILHDCFRAGDRGAATAVYSLMPFLSPAVAPIMGGYMTQYVTWRWVFWATSIFDIVVQIACLFLLDETHHPTILANKAKALRRETGNPELYTKWQGPDHSLKKILMKSLIRPFIMITTQPALQSMALFRAYQYGLMYLVFATFPLVFEDSYDQDVGRASLNYLSLGVGFIIGLQISGIVQDKVYKWCTAQEVDPSSLHSTWHALRNWRKPSAAAKDGLQPLQASNPPPTVLPHAIPRKPVAVRAPTIRRRGTGKSLHDPTAGLPEYRLPLLLPFSLLIPIGMFIYGWSAQYKTHWIVPNIGTAILSIGLIVCFNCAQAYVVDTYTTYAASATGAAAFVRTMAGFSFPLFTPGMYAKLGVGWGNSVLGFVSLTLGLVAPVLLWRFGPWLRARSTYCAG